MLGAETGIYLNATLWGAYERDNIFLREVSLKIFNGLWHAYSSGKNIIIDYDADGSGYYGKH